MCVCGEYENGILGEISFTDMGAAYRAGKLNIHTELRMAVLLAKCAIKGQQLLK